MNKDKVFLQLLLALLSGVSINSLVLPVLAQNEVTTAVSQQSQNDQDFTANSPSVQTVGNLQKTVTTVREWKLQTETTNQGLSISSPSSSIAQDIEEEQEEELTITGDRPNLYRVPNSGTATKTDTPLRDVPQSVQVIPRQVIEDRGVNELGKILETGGVASGGGRGTSVFGPGFIIRGFSVNESIFRDGIPASSLSPLDSNDIEQVEILRGPASILFGQGEPGGIINLTSKQPLATPLAALSFTAGSFSDYRGDLDLSGPLNEDKSVRYRLNVSYQNFGSFRDFVNGERFIFSPAIAWDISPNTTLNFYGQYARNRETLDEGTIATENGIINLPRNRFLGEPFSEFSQDQFTLGYRLDHRFDQNWSARHALEYLAYSPRRYAPLFDGFDPNTGELSRLAYFAGGNYRRIFTNAEVTGKFDTGSIQHQVLLGVEYRNTIEKPEFQFSNSYNSINIFNPVYTRTPYAISPEFFRDDTINTVGIYVQDQITLLPNLKLLLGGRYDFINQFRTTRVIDAARREFAQSDSAFSPRVGIVYQPIEPLSIYTAYNRSFRAGFGAARNSDGSTFRPETGEQLEIGAKFDITPRLNLTLAAFDLKKQNVRTPDPNNPRFSLQTGEVTSRGIELNLGGEILPGWNITSSYNYLDTFVSRDNRNIVGNRFANVPSNQFSLWSSYTIQQGDLEGLGFGLGLFYVSDRPGNNDNTFSIPSYFRTDAAIFYKRDNWKAQLNIENLFDANYFTSSDQFLGVIRGRPLAVSGRFSVEF